MSSYDVISDVHGQADKLTGLLARLGYWVRDGVWRHPDRTPVFIGDLIDRGPQQLETIAIVRNMVDSGGARIVLGNHEYNAIAYATPDPANPGAFLRARSERHRHQHQAFLDAVSEGSPRHREFVEWFKTFPLWVELDGLRIVHACWHPDSLAMLKPLLGDINTLIEESSRKGTPAYEAVETVLKGPEIELGDGRGYCDQEGTWRTNARFRWWDPNATTLRAAAEIPGNAKGADGGPFPELPDDPITPPVEPYPEDGAPVVVGHYWRTGPPAVISANVACVDYSAANEGPLVAYRWDGEEKLQSVKFESYP
jgi:Calcineurin-like phosphoesterase